MNIRVIDSNFAHATSCSNGDLKIYPKYFNWYRGNEPQDITVFVDSAVSSAKTTPSKIKVWMLMEPPTITGHIYEMAKRPEVQALFDYILTFDKALAATNPSKFVVYPIGGCWIEVADRKIYPKTKNISIIASEKNHTEGHKLRHEIIRKYPGQIDVFGRGYKFIQSKLEALKDYRYTIVIENCQLDNYFTEKLIDPMVTGTIPIYWGSPGIHKIFNGDFYSIQYLPSLLAYPDRIGTLYQRDIEQRMVQRNFDSAQEFVNAEDWIWLNFFSKLCTTTPKM